MKQPVTRAAWPTEIKDLKNHPTLLAWVFCSQREGIFVVPETGGPGQLPFTRASEKTGALGGSLFL